MNIDEAYSRWSEKPGAETMGGVLAQLSPLINSEVQRYPGPKDLLRNRARLLAIDAVKTYNPASGARLSSWVVTQMQQLSRYGKKLSRPVHTPELAYRQAAEIETVRQRLSDELGGDPSDEQLADATGLSPARIRKVKQMSPAYFSESAAVSADTENPSLPAVELSGPDPLLRTATEAVNASLADRDRAILEFKTGLNGREQLDNKTIARRLGVSEALVSQRSLAITKMIQENYGKI